MELQGRVEDLRKAGLGLAAISYDPPEILVAFSQRRGITFPLLSDAGSATIKAYGILNTVAGEAIGVDRDEPVVAADVKKYVSVTASRNTAVITNGTPFPGTFVVDRAGRVTSRHFEEFYRERSTVANIMLRLGGRVDTVAATKISTDHLEITTYAGDATVAPGERTALVIEVRPRPRIHVYAPDASGYRSVTLTMVPEPLVRVLPIQFPRSEIYFFKPLNERVPVYQKPFTLLQELVLEVTPQAEAAFRSRKGLTIGGTLEYQACDDKICFNPVAVPLSWTLSVTPNITERLNRSQ
ncbi:MAG: redoxin domain-containing protein [Acidobacteria bacterium]|nr:redoxin domain-containing protein [Acidobacteriota bacterium]